MSVLFVTAVYDVYGSSAPAASRLEALWRRLGVIAPHLPWLHVFGDEDDCPLSSHLPNVTYTRLSLGDVPLHAMLAASTAAAGSDNPVKDTKAYMRLICCKPEFAALAAERCVERGEEPPRLVAWVDAGISKVLRCAEQDVPRLASEMSALAELGGGESHVVVPGCWSSCVRGGEAEYTRSVLWRFCGGFFFATPSLMRSFADATALACARLLETTGSVTWEVNAWAYAEAHLAVPIRWSKGDHDSTIFDCVREALVLAAMEKRAIESP